MTTIQIASDLHIEFNESDAVDPLEFITPCADILVLAGDIGSLYRTSQLSAFITKLCKLFKAVVYIPGNHEYYTYKSEPRVNTNVLKSRLHALKHELNNLYILDTSSIVIDNTVCIAGCTLWSDLTCKLPRFIVRIHDINTERYRAEHEFCVQYVNNMIDYCQHNKYKLVMVTHYPPTYTVLKHAKKRKKFESLYASNLDYLLHKDKVHTWVCGHVHSNFDFVTKEGCRVVGNQKGKVKDKITDYNKEFVVSIR